ncbi:PAS/PAC sensor-containing diguanylate cyclase/phosphodiesterase [Thauera linaloolentis 47Lol = DSM 12138]|uniref:PAS/PAC sensor-containing diguanylate cyclase/phosphodiesterase n=1 Tax=Thauera linaloolentis (strain DSM 12138 / JCM 21573 / CCUG 41526 / CIP 105981 / IAM 15112 / NBRC 102519 / 47Lol) TaxID=1123367 RepID=N6Z5I1_THAL4|nr:EAL domain-containing protein [Thauera linaloolentis]ENO89812.1 PAS/PAC sensor-containing diguanylate cyclase/phosphodiesterase [Thauera linaloolentis 47Lol = DSM 12138]
MSEGAEAGVYLALLELIDEGLIITGDELILDANSAACKLLERDYRQIAGRPLATLFPNEERFLDVRARLLIQGERRSQVGFALPDGRTRELKVLCAPRLRPGVHALVLSPSSTRSRSASRSEPAGSSESAAHARFAAHLDPGRRVLSRPGSLFDAAIWPDAGTSSFEPRLWQALDQDEFLLNFQPLVDTRSKRLRAGEALLRWQHPTLGQLPFGRFKAAIHDPQLIARLGDWALNSACRSARTWQGPNTDQRVKLTVNVATEQLLHGDFAECVRLVLEDNDLPPGRLELDLDEKVLESDSPGLLATLKALSAMGVRLAIDDFGRGLSSIPRLRRYPLNAIKLAPGLVRGVGHDEDSEAVVEAIVGLAATLGLEVFARGVETPAQRDFLSALDCHLQQGPLFGQPMTAHEFSRFVP